MTGRFLEVGLAAAATLWLGCASATSAPEALYLSVEVHEGGRPVASPRLLGFDGRTVVVERRAPSSAAADYRLTLRPRREGAGYRVLLDLDLPSGRRVQRLGLRHGEAQRVALDDDTELKVLLMRVDSPEFRALIQRAPSPLSI